MNQPRPRIAGTLGKLVLGATALVLVAAATVAALPSSGSQAHGATTCLDGDIQVTRSAVIESGECSLEGRTVTSGTLHLQIPEAGIGVEMTTVGPNPKGLSVRTQPDGTVSIGVDDDVLVGAVGMGSGATNFKSCKGCPKPCSDGNFSLLGYYLPADETFHWYYNDHDAPTSPGPDQTSRAVQAAMAGLLNGNNNCGQADQIEISTEYMGATTADADAQGDGNCAAATGPNGRDGQSTVDWGELLAPGFTCSWYMIVDGPDELVESDTLLDRSNSWTVRPTAKNCKNNKWDLQGVLAHEFGHTFGLGHVSPKHGNLTMSTRGLGPCSTSYRTYGLGDLKGLEERY